MAGSNNGQIIHDQVRTSDAAHAAWSRNYNTRRVTLARGDPEPFRPGRWLGRGGWSEVFDTDLGGTVVALKRVYFRNSARERPRYLNELNVLEKMSGKRHRHVVELIGCYELPVSGGRSQLGILVWPVAQCDLSRFLGCVDLLRHIKLRIDQSEQGDASWKLKLEEQETLEEAAELTMLEWRDATDLSREELLSCITRVYDASLHRLHTVFGCLAQAIAYLHNDQKIRHKDLKPSQVLLSSDGLWLTDFGWSTDISDLSNSASNNGETISVKFHAPERASREDFCGRPEDIFALGCTYLEMAYRICGLSAEKYLNQRADGWSYQAHLVQIDNWLEPLQNSNEGDAELKNLTLLIKQMMAKDPSSRPLIHGVVDTLTAAFSGTRPFFGPCCSSNL